MRIYLSGPISNNPNYLIDFANAQRELEAKGHEVINPARLSQFFPESITKDCEPGSENYKRILIVEAEIIRSMADRVMMLKGWSKSRGARFEKKVAENEGIPILYAEDAESEEEPFRSGGIYARYESANGYSANLYDFGGFAVFDRDGNEILHSNSHKTPEEVAEIVDGIETIIEALKEGET